MWPDDDEPERGDNGIEWIICRMRPRLVLHGIVIETARGVGYQMTGHKRRPSQTPKGRREAGPCLAQPGL